MLFVDRLNGMVKLSPKMISRIKDWQVAVWDRYEANHKIIAFCGCWLCNWLARKNLKVTPRLLLLIPNLISLSRLFILPIFWLGWVLGVPQLFYPVVYSLLMALDLIDGPIARQCGLGSTLGKAIDPLADKISHLSILSVAVLFGLIPVWLLIILSLKEIALVPLAETCREAGAKWYGKLGTLTETMVFLGAFLLPVPFWVFVVLATSQVGILIAYAI